MTLLLIVAFFSFLTLLIGIYIGIMIGEGRDRRGGDIDLTGRRPRR
jgi:hypothetical protein